MVGDFAAVAHPKSGPGCIVHLLRREAGRWQWESPMLDPEPSVNINFGATVEMSGRWLAVGTHYRPSNGMGMGRRFYMHRRGSAGWELDRTFDVEFDYGSSTTFASAMALDGDTLALTSSSAAGLRMLVTVYHHDGTTWQKQAELSSPFRSMGAVLALHGDTLVALDRAYSEMGSALIYRRKSGAWELEAQVPAVPLYPPHTPEIQFGKQLAALQGNRLAIGSVEKGRFGVQVYQRQGSAWKKLPSPVLPAGISPKALHWKGEALLIETDKQPGNDAALWVIQGGVWKQLSSLRSAVPDKATILTGAISDDTALVINLSEVTETHSPFGSTYSASDTPEVLFYDLMAMSVFEGPANAGTPVHSSGSTVNLGQIMVGETTTQTFTVSNDTPLLLTLNNVSITGPQAAVFQLPLPPVTLAPGATKLLTLSARPTTAGMNQATLTFSTSGKVLALQVIAVAVSARTAPQITMTTTAFLEPESKALTLIPIVSGTRPNTCQWHKNGRAVSGATFPRLHLDSLKPADAGLYRLIISSPSGKVNGPEIAVGVYRPVRQTIMAKPGQEVTMKAYAWGPDLDWHWYAEESAFVRGSRTDTLRVIHPELDPGMWVAALQMRSAYAEPARFDIYNAAPDPPTVEWQGNWILGGSVEGFGVSNFYESSPRYLVSGLPPGVRLNATTGELSGAPTRVGTYRIEWRVQARGMTSQASITQIYVVVDHYVDDHYVELGLYAGTVPVSEYLPKGGFATLYMTSSGAYSVKLQIGARVSRVAGMLGGAPFERLHTLLPVPGTTKTSLHVASSTSLDLVLEKAPDFYDDESISLQAIETGGFQSSPLPTGLMLTQPLRISAEESRPELPQGSGFASIRMSGVRTANLVGTLPDGSGMTASGPVASTADYQGPRTDSLLVYFCPTASSDWVAGSVELNSLRGSYPNDSTAQLLWGHIAHPGAATYQAAFDPVILRGRGAPYFPPSTGMLMLPLLMEPGYMLRVVLSGGGLSDEVVSVGHLTAAHKAVFALPNTGRTKLDFYVPTGFFTGSHTFAAPLRRTVSLRGMLVPAWSEGHGLFLLPGADGKVRSGRMYLDAAPILEP